MRDVQLNRQQEILMNFLRMAHLYKPSDGYGTQHGICIPLEKSYPKLKVC